MKPFIPIIELHFSNRCTGSCIMCSRAHGYNAFPYCTRIVFDAIKRNLQLVDFNVIQLGGDGDSFLNPNFLDFVKELREMFPDKTLTLFTNGYMLNKENSDRIINDRLLNNLETRIDTLDPDLFAQSTGLDLRVIVANLKYFMEHNTSVKNHIVYFPLFLYRECVREKMNKEPTNYEWIDESLFKNEYKEVYSLFHSFITNEELFNFRISEVCLWGERSDATPRVHECSQLNGAFKNQIYIYPNGNIGVCPYDDGQDTFLLGNVLTNDIDKVWTSRKRAIIIEDIKAGVYVGRYPCIDPVACDSFDIYRQRVNQYDL